jgi:hypothetical protein
MNFANKYSGVVICMFIAAMFWFAISGGSALSPNCSLLMLFILGFFYDHRGIENCIGGTLFEP